MIIDREIDAMAIDSSELENESARTPELRRHLRIIDTPGPNPMPPWVMHPNFPQALKAALRAAFLNMHHDDAGLNRLQSWRMARFDPVEDVAYDPICRMAADAQVVQLAG